MLVVFGLMLVVVAVFGFVVTQLGSRVDKLSDKLNKAQKAEDTTVTGDMDAAAMVTIESGKKGFSMTVPEGFGTIVNDAGSDFVIMPGMEQPVLSDGTKPTVRETQGYGSDSASVFAVLLSEEGMGGDPMGTSEEFTIGKGDDALVGKKYSYTYTEDTLVGIGYMRHQNDREYHYAFTTKDGKKLEIKYDVYGSDPRNLVTTVDSIVQSIVVEFP